MNTRRRWLAAGAAVPAWAWVEALRAQTNPPPLIGWLSAFRRERDPLRDAFIEGMTALGWTFRTHYRLEERYAEGRTERLPALARELAAERPVVAVAMPSAAVGAMAAAAPTLPVVVANGDPLAAGLVKNLARPGGLITGISNQSNAATMKAVELLGACIPSLQRVGFLVDSSMPGRGAGIVEEAHRAAAQARVVPVVARVATLQDIEPAVGRLAKGKAEALVLMSSSWFAAHLRTFIAQALAQRWPVVGSLYSVAQLGGLLSYGADSVALARRAAWYVDRILKGAKPGELPIEQPTIYRLVLNMRTARALGLSIPQAVLLRATEVIE